MKKNEQFEQKRVQINNNNNNKKETPLNGNNSINTTIFSYSISAQLQTTH